MTRLVCIGDCHFDSHGWRNQDRYNAFDQVVAYGMALPDLGAWLLAGDMNETKMTIEDRNAIAPRLQAMADRAPVLGVRGNHDAEGDLEIFNRLSAKYPIRFITAPEVVTLDLATDERVNVFCLPYPFKAGLVGAGVPHEQLGPAARAALEPIFIDGADQLQRIGNGAHVPLMLGHLNIGGSKTSVGQPSIGKEIELDPALLARLGGIPKIFGHIHKHQRIFDAWYLGSIARQNFGESEDKLFGVLSIAGRFDFEMEFVPLDVPRQAKVRGRLTREAFTLTEIDGESLDDGASFEQVDWRGADVRCQYDYVRAEISALDVAKVHAEFAGCRSLKVEGVPTIERDVRAPAVMAAPTLEGKVTAYCELTGVPVTPGILTKLAALQQIDPEDLIAGVAGLREPEPARAEVA